MPVESNAVRGPTVVGSSLEAADLAEALALQTKATGAGGRSMRHRRPVNYNKERIGLAGLAIY
jgi:hypothetical protein